MFLENISSNVFSLFTDMATGNCEFVRCSAHIKHFSSIHRERFLQIKTVAFLVNISVFGFKSFRSIFNKYVLLSEHLFKLKHLQALLHCQGVGY